MIKMTYCLRRQPHLTREQFQDYWLNRHGPLVRSHASALNIRRYVQFHTASHPMNEAMQKSRGASEAFDGIAEIWFDSVESMTAPGSTPAGKAAMRALRGTRRASLTKPSRPCGSARSTRWWGSR